MHDPGATTAAVTPVARIHGFGPWLVPGVVDSCILQLRVLAVLGIMSSRSPLYASVPIWFALSPALMWPILHTQVHKRPRLHSKAIRAGMEVGCGPSMMVKTTGCSRASKVVTTINRYRLCFEASLAERREWMCLFCAWTPSPKSRICSTIAASRNDRAKGEDPGYYCEVDKLMSLLECFPFLETLHST